MSRYFILASFLGAQLNLIHKKAKKSGDAATLNNIISAFCIRNRFIFCVSNDIKHGYCNIGYQFWIFVTLFADTLMCTYTVGPRLSSLAIGNANPVLDNYPLDN